MQYLLSDGDTGKPVSQGVKAILGELFTAQIAKRNELVLSKRWIVGCSFAWLEKASCERKLNTSLQSIHLAFLALLFKRSQIGSKTLAAILPTG